MTKGQTWQKIKSSEYSVQLNGNELILVVMSADRMLKTEINVSPVYEFCKEVFRKNPELLKEKTKK